MKIEWNKVTWYSKLAAVILFVGVFILGFLLGAKTAHACSPMSNYDYPTVNSVLAEDGHVVLAQMIKGGSEVDGDVLRATTETATTIKHRIGGDSCSTRFEDYFKGEYIVTVAPSFPVDRIIEPSDLDSEFSFSFQKRADAEAKFNELAANVAGYDPTDPPKTITPTPKPEIETTPIELPAPVIEEEAESFEPIDFTPAPRETLFQQIFDWLRSIFKRK